MPYFQYIAQNMKGQQMTGKVDVADEKALYHFLKAEGLYCIKYKEIGVEQEKSQKKLRLKYVVILAKQFATMLGAGVSVIKCIDIISHQVEDKTLKKSLQSIYENVQKGNTLSNAFKQEGELLPPLFNSMVRVGEESGCLDQMFERIATYYEKEKDLKDKVTNAMIYPIILCLVAVCVMGIILVFVIPNFFEMFQSGLDQLPSSTQFLMRMSTLVRTNGKQLLVVIAGCILMLYLLKDTKPVQQVKSYLMLHLPIIGKLNHVVISARFAQTLSIAYASGLSLLESLKITQEVLNQSLLDEALDKMRADIAKGSSFSKAIREVPVFPLMLSHMIEVGEESGQLVEMLDKTAVFYEKEADIATQRMVALLEPFMIIILGLIVGFIVAALIPPMYSMYQNVV